MKAAAAALLLLALSGSSAQSASATDGAMVRVPAGSYVPFYTRESARHAANPHRPVAVASFLLDRHAVTNAEFLAFVKSHPEWRRSTVAPLFADAHYLSHWRSDFALAGAEDGDRPVTNVSWFAADAFCRAEGKTLPTTDQWEYALADRGADSAALKARTLAWYAAPGGHAIPPVNAGVSNGFGVSGLVGLVWEWTRDFNSLLSGSDLRGSGVQFCGGASLGAADPSDYAAFMRYSMRASLKASYTTRNLGFRCAKDLP